MQRNVQCSTPFVLAARIDELLQNPQAGDATNSIPVPPPVQAPFRPTKCSFVSETIPRMRLERLILPEHVRAECESLVREQNCKGLLRSYAAEPRNRVLLIGPSGNGKASLAEAIAGTLMVPLLTVQYESILGSCPGETASRLSELVGYTWTRECVLFFDDFKVHAGGCCTVHEDGKSKGIVSTLLMRQISFFPSHVIVIAATSHDTLLLDEAVRR